MNIRKSGDPILKQKCKDVIKFDYALHSLAENMIYTMKENKGIGLAAPQVGIKQNIIIVTNPKTKVVSAYINPVIVEQKGCKEEQEGCLSYPCIYKWIERPTWIKVKAFNINGKPIEIIAKDLHARIFCHEIDHLEGKCKVGESN